MEAFRGSYNGYFLQSSIKFEKNSFLLSLDSKFNLLHFNSFEYVYEQEETQSGRTPSQKEVYSEYFSTSNQFVTQFAVSLHKRMEFINLFLQLQLCVDPNELDGSYVHSKDFFIARPLSCYFGVSLPISKFWEKEQ